MSNDPEPVLVEQTLITFLFERLLFDSIERTNNNSTGSTISPTLLSARFAYIAHYYDQLTLKQAHRWRGRAITRLALNSASGVVTFLSNNKSCFKILPDRLTEKLVLGDEAGSELCQFIICTYVLQASDLAEIRRGFVTLVPEPYREEIEFLMGMLKRSGLLASSVQAAISTGTQCIMELRHSKMHHGISDDYAQKLAAELPPVASRERKERQIVDSVKEATSMDAIVLSSSAHGIHISDYDLELLLVERAVDDTDTTSSTEANTHDQPSSRDTDSELVERLERLTVEKSPPSGEERVQAIHALAAIIKNAGFKSVVARKRYSDVSCSLNSYYVCFYDPRTQLTCQLTLYNPAGLKTRNLLQAYADIDNRVKPFMFAVQRTLDNHGRSHEALGNFAVAMIGIHYLQTKGVLPKLLHRQGRRVEFGFHTGRPENVLPKNLTSQNYTGLGQAGRKPSASTHTAQSKNNRNIHRPLRGRKTLPQQQQQGSGDFFSSVYDRVGSVPTGGVRCTTAPESNVPKGNTRDQTEPSPDVRTVPCEYDTILAKVRPFDKSVLRKSVTDLVVDFFRYTSDKFEEWEDLLIPSDGATTYNYIGAIDQEGKRCSMFMPGSAQTYLPDRFSGLVVQDPFILDRNLAWLCTGWRFRNTGRAFRHAFDSISCSHTGAELYQHLIGEWLEEQEEIEGDLEFESETGHPMGYVINDRVLDAWDEFGDSITDLRLRAIAQKMIAGCIQDPRF
ncbi:hypothetical protein BGZ95_000877 [Linnemannia exigua]|uniref:Uncharacterized protein n=1 Tax=Linnemannia exigua TaxID=604196 RepID=A0AAD4D7M6_9FUNG|nr:hypothetical protein BGZ95_000877 [Linnemannia exigua]